MVIQLPVVSRELVVADVIGQDALVCVFENETAPSIQGASVVMLRETKQV